MKIKRKEYEAHHNGLKFKIREDHPDVGAYLYVFKDDTCINDYLQNTTEICKELAFEEYTVDPKAWKYLGEK